MRVLIDADGCPVVRETVRQCAAFHVPCLLFCDTAHVFSIPGVEVFVADCGHDGARTICCCRTCAPATL